jgi:adenosine deaminase
MRSFVPMPGVSGHDQFFATFERFESLSHAHEGEWVDEIAARGAARLRAAAPPNPDPLAR